MGDVGAYGLLDFCHMGFVQNAIALPYRDFDEFLGCCFLERGAVVEGVEHFLVGWVLWGVFKFNAINKFDYYLT